LVHQPIRWTRQGVFDDSPHGIARAERHIVVCFAGPLASRKFQPRSRWRRTGTQDFETALELFYRIVVGPDQEYMERYHGLLWRRAELLIDYHWEEIQAVAADLLKHGTLDEAAVRAAIYRTHGITPEYLAQIAAGTDLNLQFDLHWARNPGKPSLS